MGCSHVRRGLGNRKSESTRDGIDLITGTICDTQAKRLPHLLSIFSEHLLSIFSDLFWRDSDADTVPFFGHILRFTDFPEKYGFSTSNSSRFRYRWRFALSLGKCVQGRVCVFFLVKQMQTNLLPFLLRFKLLPHLT